MSEFWKRKVRKYFSTFDFDSDGVISKNDFVGMANQYCKFGKADKEEHLKTEFEKLWDLFTKNVEGGKKEQITADDLINSIREQRYDPELMKRSSALITCFHDMLDVNRDGYLQEDEYERMIFQLGVPDPSFAKMAFNAIDVNGDGKLSLEEFINACFDFMFSDDEKSPNRFFFGPLDD